MPEVDEAKMQAECVVRALDVYLAVHLRQPVVSPDEHAAARQFLISTLAATICMSEPRKNDMQR